MSKAPPPVGQIGIVSAMPSTTVNGATLPRGIMMPISNMLPLAIIAALIFWTISYAKHNAAVGKAEAASRQDVAEGNGKLTAILAMSSP